ncbi:hypothetical protein Leryth_003659 [Lithospermum erythrorhizon]|nr:hypothetical protein Leryth_003659 [Lithospermum erythrorhizon]
MSNGGGGEISEEELAVLPRHTKVVVTGNNRTKSVLVGLQGTVKKAVGLGGWHWLVLTNGIEVKLQRNALSVLEAPTGSEDDDDLDLDLDHLQWNGPRVASHAEVSEELEGSMQIQWTIQRLRPSLSKVDLSKLEMAALWRYLQHFNLVGHSQQHQRQLIDVVQRHFLSQVFTTLLLHFLSRDLTFKVVFLPS